MKNSDPAANRRRFLKTSTATAALVTVPHLAHAAKANEKIVMGIIGPGGMGMNHVRGFADADNVEVAYVCDVDEKRLASAAKEVARRGRAPKAVKDFARANPPRMRAWPEGSRTHVSTMSAGDFRSNETAVTLAAASMAKIEHVSADGAVTFLKEPFALEAGEVLDGTFMSKRALIAFFREQLPKNKNLQQFGVILDPKY